MFTTSSGWRARLASPVARAAGVGGLLVLALALAAPSAALGVYVRGQVDAALAQREASSRVTTAELTSSLVFEALGQLATSMALVCRDPDTVEAFAADGDQTARDAVVDRLLAIGASTGMHVDIGAATAIDGGSLARAPRGEPPPNLADRDWFVSAISGPNPYVSDGIVGRLTGIARVIVAQAVRDDQGRPLAVLSMAMDAPYMLEALKPIQRAPGQEIVVLDRSAQVLASTDPGRVVLSRPWQGFPVDRTRVSEGRDVDGRVITGAPAGDTGWVVLLVDDPAVLFAPERSLQSSLSTASLTTLLATLGATGAALALFYFLVRAHRRISTSYAERDRLATIVDSTDAALLSTDAKGVFTSWNSGAERLYGWTAAEAMGRGLDLIVPPERTAVASARVERLRHAPVPPFETLHRRKDGSPIEVAVTLSPLRGRGGAFVGSAAVIRDLTERHEAERTRAQLAAIVDSSAAAIVGTDRTGRVTSWNRGAQQLFGWRADEIVGKDYTLLGVPERRHLIDESITSVVRDGTPISTQAPVLRNDGTRLFAHLTLSPVVADDGSVMGTALVARDITAQHLRQEDLERYNKALAALDRQREEFLSLMAHELRSPVAGIGLLAGGLATAPGLNERDRKASLTLRSQAEALSGLAEDILSIAQLESGGGSLHRVTADVRDAIRDVDARVADARVHVDLPKEPIRARIDRLRLGRAVENLVRNAIKYSDGRVGLRLARDNGHVRIDVRDDGVGLGPDDMPLLFAKYGRIPRSAARVPGIGLGLYLTRLLVQAHEGTVAAVSDGPGRGSTFTILLPSA